MNYSELKQDCSCFKKKFDLCFHIDNLTNDCSKKVCPIIKKSKIFKTPKFILKLKKFFNKKQTEKDFEKGLEIYWREKENKFIDEMIENGKCQSRSEAKRLFWKAGKIESSNDEIDDFSR